MYISLLTDAGSFSVFQGSHLLTHRHKHVSMTLQWPSTQLLICLTIKCISVSIYHTDNGSSNIYSHARDEYGKTHIPQVHVYSISILYTLVDNYELRRQRRCAQTFQKRSGFRSNHCFVTVLFRMVQNYKDHIHQATQLNDWPVKLERALCIANDQHS